MRYRAIALRAAPCSLSSPTRLKGNHQHADAIVLWDRRHPAASSRCKIRGKQRRSPSFPPLQPSESAHQPFDGNQSVRFSEVASTAYHGYRRSRSDGRGPYSGPQRRNRCPTRCYLSRKSRCACPQLGPGRLVWRVVSIWAPARHETSWLALQRIW